MKLPAAVAFGILTSPRERTDDAAVPPEPRLCLELSLASQSMAMDVFTFSAADYDPRTHTLHGSRFTGGAWERQLVPLPDIVYDRSFCRSLEERRSVAITLAGMREQSRFHFLNGKLPGKLTIYQTLLEDESLAPCLPRTTVYTEDGLKKQLQDSGGTGLILKPAAGMQGRGLVHLVREPQTKQLLASGRTRSNLAFSRSFAGLTELSAWLQRFMRGAMFLIQP